MIVSKTGNNLYLLKSEKIYKVTSKSIWGLIYHSLRITIKEFWEKL